MALPFAVLCTGQGAQSPQMFDLAGADPRGRAVLDAFGDALGTDLPARARAGDGLFDNAFAQPAIVAAAAATWATLAPRLPTPALFAGYSVGEVSAWACAGAWEIPTVAAIATTRARLMDAASPPDCGMLAVRGLLRDALLAEAPGLHIAIVNDADHFVLAGPAGALAEAETRLTRRGAGLRRLDVRVPSHTPWMAEAAAALRGELKALAANPVGAPVLRGIDGTRCTRSADAPDALARAVCEPIRWDACMRAIVESGVEVVLELGPGNALARLFGDAHPAVAARSVSDFRSLDGVLAWIDRQTGA